MSYTFPKNQEDGTEIELDNGVIYVYNSLKKTWEVMSKESEKASGGLFTISSAGNNFLFYNSTSNPPPTNMFTAPITSTRYNIEWHLYNMFDDRGATVYPRDYVATPTTVWEVYADSTNPELRVRTTIKNWKTSNRNGSCIMFNASGPAPSAYDGVNLAHNGSYFVSLSNLKKKI